MFHVLLFISLVSGSPTIAAIYSSSTSEEYLKTLSILSNHSFSSVQIINVSISSQTPSSSLEPYSLLVDFTSSSILSSKLRRFSYENEVPLLCIDECPEENPTFIFNLFENCEKTFKLINKTLEVLNWTNYAVFYDDFRCSEEVSLMLRPKDRYFVSYQMEELAHILVSKFLKTSGVKQWVFTGGYLTSLVLEKKLRENNMIKTGNAILAGPFSYFGLQEIGILEISEQNFESFESFEEFLAELLVYFIEKTGQANSNLALLSILKSARHEIFKPKIFNIQQKGKIEVLNLECQDCRLLEEIIYLGGSSSPPLNPITYIPMSLTAGITDPTNVNQKSNQEMMNGVYIAIDLYNEMSGALENFKFTYKDIPCYFSSLYLNISCYKNYTNDLGLFHMSAHAESYSIMLYSFTSSINLNLFGSSDGLIMANKNNYPLYISTGTPHKYEVSALVQIIKFLGFDKFAVLAVNNTYFSSWISFAITDAYNNKLEILNDLKDYIFNASVTGQIIGSESVFEKIVDSKARIVFVACSALALTSVMNKFSDLGLKKGDIYFAVKNVNFPVLVNYSDPTFHKRKKFIQGTFSLTSGFFVGEKGNFVESELKSKYKTYSRRSCDYFDSFSLGYYGIKSLIIQGKDYEKSSSILTEARKARFIGCNGSIKVVDYTNLRESELYVISQLGEAGSNFTMNLIINYYPSGSTVFQVVKAPFWKSEKTPSSVRVTSWDCPFNPDDLKTFEKGQAVVGCVCAVIGIFTLINTLVIWKKFWNKEVEDLACKEEISFQDSVALATVLLELIQTASMGPDLGKLLNAFKSVASALSYSIEDFISVENGIFWYVLGSVLILVAFWVLLCVVWFFKLHVKFSDFWLFRFFGWSIVNLMPIIGNLMFIPIISTLVNVFICDQSLDDTFDESYLSKDCYQQCWDSSHFPVAVLSGVFILLYQPLAVYFRPLWQDLLPLLHIKALPKYLMLKSVFQVILIILNKTLKRFSPGAHSIVFIAFVAFYSFMITLKESYNYPRLRLWHRLGSFGLVFLTLVCIFNEYLYTNQTVWLPILIIGWVVIVIIGWKVQSTKFPSLLFRTANKDIEKIFRWMFNLERSNSIFQSVKYQHKSQDNSKEQNSNDRMIFNS